MRNATNKLYEFIGKKIDRINDANGKHRQNGLSIKSIAEKIGVDRFFFWQISHIRILEKRKGILEKTARTIMERLDKLEFLSGINPWTDLPLSCQETIYNFAIAVKAYHEAGNGQITVDTCKLILNDMMGEANVKPNDAHEYDEKNMGDG